MVTTFRVIIPSFPKNITQSVRVPTSCSFVLINRFRQLSTSQIELNLPCGLRIPLPKQSQRLYLKCDHRQDLYKESTLFGNSGCLLSLVLGQVSPRQWSTSRHHSWGSFAGNTNRAKRHKHIEQHVEQDLVRMEAVNPGLQVLLLLSLKTIVRVLPLQWCWGRNRPGPATRPALLPWLLELLCSSQRYMHNAMEQRELEPTDFCDSTASHLGNSIVDLATLLSSTTAATE